MIQVQFDTLTRLLVASETLLDQDLLKLWRSFFFCYVHFETGLIGVLGTNVAIMMLECSHETSLRNYHIFLKTLTAQWSHVDGVRYYKLRTLEETVLSHLLKLFTRESWISEVTSHSLTCIGEYLFMKYTKDIINSGLSEMGYHFCSRLFAGFENGHRRNSILFTSSAEQFLISLRNFIQVVLGDKDFSPNELRCQKNIIRMIKYEICSYSNEKFVSLMYLEKLQRLLFAVKQK